MTWFKVDDSFYSHPKVIATDPAALGLWVLAGSWSSAHLTEGYVRDDVLQRLLPDAATLARKLVDAGLWKRKRGGYQFHDWFDQNPSKDAVEKERAAKAERQRRWREKQRRRVTRPSTNATSNGAPAPPRPEGSGGGDAPERGTPPGHRPDGPAGEPRAKTARALAIANCPLCDDTGYAGKHLCDHDPHAPDRAKRGRALVDAALQRKDEPA